jgi:hypothetical protein
MMQLKNKQALAVCLLLVAALTQAFMPATLSTTQQGMWSGDVQTK